MWYGVVNTLLQSRMEYVIKSFFNGSEDTIKKCNYCQLSTIKLDNNISMINDIKLGLFGVGIFAILVPVSNSLVTFMITSTFVSAFQAYLYPLSSSLLSKSVDPKEQGSLLGAAESFLALEVNFFFIFQSQFFNYLFK